MSVRLIAGHEIRRQLMQPFVWVFAAVLVALMAWQFLIAVGAYLQAAPRLGAMPNAPGVTDLVAIPVLRALSTLMLVAIPLLTMRSIAGERREHSLVLLLAAGIGDRRIVLGKFLGIWVVSVALIVLMSLLPWSLAFGAALDGGRMAAAVLGLVLHAMALTAIGIFCSACTAQPALAAAAAFVVSVLLGLVDAGARMEGVEHGSINYVALPTHLEPFLAGIVSTVDIVYFGLLTALALAFAVLRLDAIRRLP